jgi:hypothetical protein
MITILELLLLKLLNQLCIKDLTAVGLPWLDLLPFSLLALFGKAL